MKVTKQDVRVSRNRGRSGAGGKKFKNISSGKTGPCEKIVLNHEIISGTPRHLHKGIESSKLKSLEKINVITSVNNQESLVSPDTRVVLSGDGILRQALLSASFPGHEEKVKDGVGKKSDSLSKSHRFPISEIKLSCSSPVQISAENTQMPFATKMPTLHALSSKSSNHGTLLKGTLGNLSHISRPPVSHSSCSLTHGTLPLMSLSSGPLPPVSEIPRPGSIPSLTCSSPSSGNSATDLTDSGIVATMASSFGDPDNVSVLSEVSSYEISQLGSHSLKVLTPLTNVTTSLPRARTSVQSHNGTSSSSSKEGSVTLVYSSIPKLETSVLNTSHNIHQKIVPLPPMSEMKSRRTSHLHALSHGKVNNGSSINHSGTNNVVINGISPINSNILSAGDDSSHTSVSILNNPVPNNHGSSTNPIKLDDGHDSTEELNHRDTISRSSVSHSINFHTDNVGSGDLNHIIIPVSGEITSTKTDDNSLTHDIGQIITIPLTSSAIYGHPVGISIPIAGNAVPLSMPVQVSSGMLPMSCSLLPVSGSALQASNNDHSTPITISENSSSILQNSGAIRAYPITTIPDVGPNSMETNTTETVVQQHSRLSSDISGLVTVTASSMMLPISSSNSLTSVASVSAVGASGDMIPITSSTESIPVTSVSVSLPSSTTTTTTTTMVFASQNAADSVTAYTIQSPSEILSQLSKAGVLPTMSSSQVSSVLSALGSDSCHLDLESDSSHHVELMSQHQVMQLSSSTDKVSTLTQTEDFVELGCNINIQPRDNKVISVPGEVHLVGGGRLMEQHLHLLNSGRSGLAPLSHGVSLSDKQNPISKLSTESVHVGNAALEHQVQANSRVGNTVGFNSVSQKQLPSVFPRIAPKLKSTLNEPMTPSLIKESLNPKMDIPKLLNPQQISSVFIKENFGNYLNHRKLQRNVNDVIFSRKRKLEDTNGMKPVGDIENVQYNKESRDENIDEVELEEVEEVPCYKCEFCPFLTLEKKGMALHFELVHHSTRGGQQESRQRINCPGCSNIFFTSKALRVHLSQDHLVGNEELKTLVDIVMKVSHRDAKIKNRFEKKRKNIVINYMPEISTPVNTVNDEISNTEDIPNIVNRVIEPNQPMNSEMTVAECNKIRVRNLNSEPVPELSSGTIELSNNTIELSNNTIELSNNTIELSNNTIELSNNTIELSNSTIELSNSAITLTESTLVNDVRDEESMSSNGASDGDAREGNLIIDDDPLTQQKRANAKVTLEDACDFKMIKTDEQVLLQGSTSDVPPCDPADNSLGQKEQRPELKLNSITSPGVRRKRGRPKGSKNVPDNGYRKLTPAQKLAEKQSGYRCELDGCAVRLRSHDNIEYHRRCHLQDKFLCPECKQEVAHWNALSTHLWRYHVIDMELYACDQCGYKTNSYSKLMNVHHRIHGDERPFLCDTCGKGFKNPKQMRNHKTIHNAKSGPGGKCDVCGRTFSNARMLRIHKDNVHGKLRPHLCNFCGYSASSRSTLKMHLRLHTGEKPFHCDECDYVTSDHNSLRRHKMRHSGDKPYKCPHCAYACIQSSTYKAHLNTKHPGLVSGLMFSCSMCSFRSVRKDNYMAHITEHESGSNPSNKHRKHNNNTKTQNEPSKTVQDRDTTQRAEKSRLPVIINISNMITPGESEEGTLSQANVEDSGNVHLIYNGNSVDGLLQQSSEAVEEGRFGVEMSSDSVIHLVEDLDTNSNPSSQSVTQTVQTLCVANIETVTPMPLTPEFEAEQITGDIQDIKEPQELKFKVAEDLAS